MLSIAAALATLFTAGAAKAANYDPRMTWRTITTEHFHITFHQGEEALAEEFSHVVEEVYDTMTDEVQWKPRRRVEVVIVDRTDFANGYARVVPYNAIVLFATAPTEGSTLELYDDWASALFTHELTHVLHMDSNHGIVRAARGVVGRIASTNDVSPPWMIEGFATFQETRHTPGGRGRTPYVDMIKRTAVLDDAFPPLGNLDGLQAKPPGGNLRYLFGQDFIQYVADHTGEDTWTKWVHTYGSHIPFVLPSKKVFGKRLVPLYFDWRDEQFAKYTAQADAIRAQGETHSRLVSDTDMSCSSPNFSPDGEKLVWSCYDLKTGSSIWMADDAGYAAEKLLQDFGASNFTWRSDSKAFVYASTHLVNRFNSWSDIYLFDLDSKRATALTSGARARDPEFSPDGSHLLYVTNKVQNNQLERMTVDRQRKPLTAYDDHTQISTPRFSPDGKAVAVTLWRDGRRDLWLFDPDGTPQRRLTADQAVDRDPAWSEDGRWLFFSSDRTGVPNIFAIDVQSEELFQVTNVLTGAVRPSVHPKFKYLAFQQYSAMGWDVRVMDLDPEQFIPWGKLAQPIRHGRAIADLTAPITTPVVAQATFMPSPDDRPPRHIPGTFAPGLAAAQSPGETLGNFDQIDVEDVYGEEQDYPFSITPHRYNPLPTLLPRYWLPYFQLSPYPSSETFQLSDNPNSVLNRGLVFSAATGTADTLAHFGWSGGLSFRTDANFVGGSAAFTVNRWIPVYTARYSVAAAPSPIYQLDPETLDANGDPVPVRTDALYWQSRKSASLTVSYPYKPRVTIFGEYRLSLRDGLTDIPDTAFRDAIPLRGVIGQVGGGWRYAWSQQTATSISTEDGRIFSLVGSLLTPLLGTSLLDNQTDERIKLTQLQLASELREYVVNPWVPNHVLAMRLAAGATLGGENQFLGNYQLGGSFGDGAYYVLPDSSRMLRGYPIGSDVGDRYWLAGAEYRLPLWRMDRGVGTLPVFARTLSASAFVDAGNAFGTVRNAEDIVDGTLVGVGAEVSARALVGWGMGLNGRLGYGVGLTPPGFGATNPRAFYFQLGGSF